MGKYKDKELDRILSESDALLADLNLNLYETPAEEAARKKREEEERLRVEAEERKRAEEEARQRAEEEVRQRAEEEACQRAEEEKSQCTAAEEARQRVEEEAGQRAEEEKRQCAEEEACQRTEEEARQRAEEEGRLRETAEKPRRQEKAHLDEVMEVSHPEAEQIAASERVKASEEEQKERLYLNAVAISFMIVSFMFMEVITHIGCYKTLGSNIFYPLFFAGSLGCVTCLLSSFLHVKVNTWIAFLLQILFAAYCDLQLIYYAAMGTFMRILHPRDDMWLLVHSEQIKEAITATLPWLVLMFLPIVLWAVIGRRYIRFERSHILTKVVLLLGMIIFAVVGVVLLDVKGYENYSPYTAFYQYESGETTEQAGNQLGMTALIVLELFNHN